ncbi:hypothetical protein SAMN02745225_02293 [Ferrithrix thermotolerans DSM 19514]|uniref:Uncharacterized protein n=1 Tax=Ferrithrix thermotolerans DSM 19514 TaxID=1121881 RepID=A0A1M4YB77_9ACTN|nr:hypothetical protein [Ferrithrix thermotolerans]SHF02985.1 hypothetical protein SAMN02745225_02293 [Ferrithrix thermotolerans DSM 19514]
MPKITKIVKLPANPPKYTESKVLVYIDGQRCTLVRERTWQAMNLKVGDSIDCDELKKRENFHWKNEYSKKDKNGKNAWDKEKVRLSKVRSLINGIDTRIEAEIVGFGADSTDMIPEHPKESGKPDIEVYLRDTRAVLIYVEVTGTEVMRGDSYWIRPDKLEYAKAHPDQDVWFILHYAKPSEKYVFIKPIPGKKYTSVQKVINRSTEYYVEFSDEDASDFERFKGHLVQLLSKLD